MKKLLLFIISFLILIPSINAMPTTYNRSDYDNLGVNKKWNINDSNRSNVYNTPLIDASKKIYDFSEVLTEEEENTLYSKAIDFINHTGFDIAILIDSLSYSNDMDNAYHSADFYDYNDFGINNTNYSGVVFYRNTYSADPYYGLYTFGDAQLYYHYDTGREDIILDDIYDEIHNGYYVDGISKLIDYLNYYYDQGIPEVMEKYEMDDMGYLHKKYQPPYLFAIIIAVIIDIIVMGILKSKNKTIRKATDASNYVDNSKIVYTKKEDNYVTTHVTRVYIAPSSSSSGGGGSFHGSSGGGFSGGGRHG